MARRARSRRGPSILSAPPSQSTHAAALQAARTSVARARRRAAASIRIERTVPALAPSAAIIGLWAAAALFGLAAALPPLATAPLTALAGAAAVWIGWNRVQGIAPTRPEEIDRRIERVSHLPHRPFAALADRPALVAGDGEKLWAAHQARAEAALARRLHAGLPVPALAPIDRFGLRFVVPAALLAGLVVARENAGALLLAAAAPGIVPVPGPAGSLQAWISPPAFTGEAPVFLHGGTRAVTVPAGSTLTATLTGSDAIPRLRGPGGRRPVRFTRLSDGSWQAQLVLEHSAPIRIRQSGHAIADWDVRVIPNGTPDVAWDGAPGAYHGGWRTRLPWRVSYQYGVTALTAELVPVKPPGAPAIVLRIPLGGEPHDAKGTEIPDLSASPFAGTEVAGRLVARDAQGGEGVSAIVRFVLPARPFHNPLARAVLDVRRRLAVAPDDHDGAASDLETLADVPHAFDRPGASGLYLNLESVASLLRIRGDRGASDDAEARLWDLALMLEDAGHPGAEGGRAALALRSAREAVDAQLQRMRELGAKGQSPAEQAELARRIEALRRAMANRMHALMQEALRHGTMLPPDAAAQADGGQALKRMLDQLEDAARNGKMDEAARQLSQMEDMLDRMRAATPDEVRRALQQMQGQHQAATQMAALQDMVRREAALLDNAQRREAASRNAPAGASALPPGFPFAMPPESGMQAGPEGAPPGAPQGAPQDGGNQTGQGQGADPSHGPAAPGGSAVSPPASSTDAGRAADRRIQRALARAAGALSDQFGTLTGKKPEALGRAGGAMARAEAALKAGDDGAAAAAEQEALNDLQSGGHQMASTLKSGGSSGQPGGLAPAFAAGDSGSGGSQGGDGSDDGSDRGGRDPLGRKLDGNGRATADDTELALPDEQARARSRQIEEELRRRDSDRERPREELQYLDRLLQSF